MGTYSIEHMALSDPARAPGAEHVVEQQLATASPAPRVREVDLDWRSVLVLLAALVGLIAFTGLFRSVPRTITALGVAVVVALGLDPVVELVRRRLRLQRAPAIAVVLAGLAALFAVVGWLLVPPAVEQARDLGDEVPRVVEDLGDLPVIGDDLREAEVPERLQRRIEELPDRLAGDTTPLERAARRVVDGVLAVGLMLLLAVTLLLDGPRLVDRVRALVPEHRRERAVVVARLTHRVVGHYVAGSLAVAGIAGVVVLVVGLALGVPLTPLAAVWVALWDLVPQIGGAAGGIPFVLLGFSQGVATGVACAAIFVVYLQIENHVLGPLLVGQAVKLSPPATMAAALVGVSAGGVVGALLAVPLTGAAKAAYIELRRPPS
ncbi:MAG TPA: AI-2E family transporter [Acidimicrobiales bacterium]|nr:AI-2E family transporter [Acidimicrobiales bacterium]